MSRQKRMIALLLTAILSFLVMLSVSYVAENADHSCSDRSHCPVCYQIDVSNHVLKKLIPVAVFLAAVSFLYVVIRMVLVCVERCSMPTLVSMKVKLSN